MTSDDEALLAELRRHLLCAEEWADPADLGDPAGGWSCVRSTLEAVEQGDVGLALNRWDDLVDTASKPRLGERAERRRPPRA